jgi:hypothetical protein
MQSRETVHAPRLKLSHPQLVRVCFESLAPVQLLLSLIRSSDAARGDKGSLRNDEFQEGRSYCLVDACIDDEMRCATIFQVWPKYKLVLGGVYAARSLEAGGGLAYLEFLRNPKLASGSEIPMSRPSRAVDGSNQQSIDAALSMLLLTDGAVLRSATLQDLTHLTAEQNYVRVHLVNGENVVVRGPLQKYEDVLPKDFIRASRHVIINVRKVQRLRRVSRDLGIVYFAGDGEQTIRLGRKASIMMRTALLTRSGLPMTRSGSSATPGTTPDAPTD